MSFILDALKKSENERQEHGGADFAAVPASTAGPRAPRWLWVLGTLLAVNVVVLLGLLLRRDVPAEAIVLEQPVAVEEQGTTSVDSAATFSEQIDVARSSRPTETAVTVTTSDNVGEAAPVRGNPESASTPVAGIPSFTELRVNSGVSLPDLHIDIHVYSDEPADRFVFINMSKLREGSQLKEGPTVREITSDGVVLNYSGTDFLLPRD